MKKNGLFKAVGAVILFYVLLTWLLPIGLSIFGKAGEASYQIGLTSIGSVVIEAFSGFGNILVFILLIGGFYGVLKATGAYEAAVSKLGDKFKGKEKGLLIGIIVLLAIISSITGLELGLFFIFPFIISLVLYIGYDKLVAMLATFGATMIGMYGATFASTLYGINNSILSTKATSEIWTKVILFVLGLALLIIFTLQYIKKDMGKVKEKKVKKEVKAEAKKVKKTKKSKEDKGNKKDKKASKADSKKHEVVKEEKVEKEVINKNCKVWPILVGVLAVTLVFILGTTAWKDIFGFNWLETAHTAWTEFTIKDFAIVNKIFGGVDAMGTWANPTRFQFYSLVLLLVSVLVSLLYRVKAKDAFDGFVEGVKEFVVPALLTLVACSMFVFVYYNPAINYISNWFIGLTDEFNVAITGIYTIVNSVFYVDYYYFAYYVLSTLVSQFTDTGVYPLLSVMFTNLYALVMLIAPTSVLLLTSLATTGVSYKEWFKFIWKLFLALLVVSFIVFAIVWLI